MEYLIERAAAAMVNSRPVPEGHVRGDVDWDFFRSMARAALTATADYIDEVYGDLHPGAVCIRSSLKQTPR